MQKELKPCPWHQNHKGKRDISFSVIDDDFGQYVKSSLIKYCPFCGRSLEQEAEDE